MRDFADVNGTRLSYEVAGDGTPVVLIHGFSLDHRMWDDQFAVFAARHRVLRYDLRGFGASAVPDGPYRHVDDLRALMRSVGIERAAIIGLSLGGSIAIDFALTYPDAVTALIPVDFVIGGYAWSAEWQAAVTPVWCAGRGGDITGAKRLWLDCPLFAPARRDAVVAARLAAMVAAYSGWHWAHRDPAHAIEPPAITRLGEIRAPTCLMIGEKDVPDFRVMHDLFVLSGRYNRTVTIPDAGHMTNMEQPGPFNDAVLDFLAHLPSGGGL